MKLDRLSGDEAELSYDVRITYSVAATRAVENGDGVIKGQGGEYTDRGTCCWHDGYPTWRRLRGDSVGEIRMDAARRGVSNSGVYTDRNGYAMELERR
ncbi:MAG: hypothetical protein QM783_11140 [Phycisphaerales bacterium]